MENKKFIIIIFFILILTGGFLFLQKVQSYDSKCGHIKLTENIAKIYNQYYEPDLTKEQIAWLKWGAEHEDTPVRYLNHFYDPINNRGWANQLTAKQWAQDSVKQSLPGFFGDYSWPKAIYAYQQGNQEYAYKALGHILHLMQDMSVPAHTRNDTHLPFESAESPYENWVEKYCQNNNFNFSGQLIIYDNLNAYFDNLALYSNNYFYSADSIGEYEKPAIVRRDANYLYGKDENDQEIRLAYVLKAKEWRNLRERVDYKLDDNVISDYFQRLGKKAVQSGAGVIYLFHQETAKQKIEKPANIWSIIQDFVKQIFQKQPKEAMIGQSLIPEADFSQEPNNQETMINNQTITNLPITNNQTVELKQEPKPETKITQSQPKIPASPAGRQKPETETASQPNPKQAPAFFPIGGPKPIPEPEPEPESEPIPPDITPPSKPILISPQAIDNFILTNASTTQLIGSVSADTDQVLIFINNATTTASLINQGWSYNLSLENATTSLQIISQDQAGNSSEALNLEIASDTLAPNTYTIIQQNLVGSLPEPGLIQLLWGVLDNHPNVYNSGFKQIKIFYKKDGGEWQLWQDFIAGQNIEPYIYSPQVDGYDYYFLDLDFQTEKGSKYQLKTLTYDQAGNFVEWQYGQEIYFALVVANEIAWMGTTISSYNEWIELYNNASSTIVLDGWTLKANDGTPSINLTGDIEPGEYLVLERGQDKDYTGALGNNGETLYLRNKQGLLIDIASYPKDGPPGNNSTKQTMERAQNGTWQTSLNINGTPRAKNSN